MAIKRSFSVKDNKGRACLKCGRTLPLEQMKDNTICTCVCGQKMFVDRYDSKAVLTVYASTDRVVLHLFKGKCPAAFKAGAQIGRAHV